MNITYYIIGNITYNYSILKLRFKMKYNIVYNKEYMLLL